MTFSRALSEHRLDDSGTDRERVQRCTARTVERSTVSLPECRLTSTIGSKSIATTRERSGLRARAAALSQHEMWWHDDLDCRGRRRFGASHGTLDDMLGNRVRVLRDRGEI